MQDENFAINESSSKPPLATITTASPPVCRPADEAGASSARRRTAWPCASWPSRCASGSGLSDPQCRRPASASAGRLPSPLFHPLHQLDRAPARRLQPSVPRSRPMKTRSSAWTTRRTARARARQRARRRAKRLSAISRWSCSALAGGAIAGSICSAAAASLGCLARSSSSSLAVALATTRLAAIQHTGRDHVHARRPHPP